MKSLVLEVMTLPVQKGTLDRSVVSAPADISRPLLEQTCAQNACLALEYRPF